MDRGCAQCQCCDGWWLDSVPKCSTEEEEEEFGESVAEKEGRKRIRNHFRTHTPRRKGEEEEEGKEEESDQGSTTTTTTTTSFLTPHSSLCLRLKPTAEWRRLKTPLH